MPDELDSAAKSLWRSQTYRQDLPDNIEPFRRLLEDYSHIPANEVDPLLHTIRDKAWAVAPFPCVGRWSFTNLRYTEDQEFQTVIGRLRKSDSHDVLLDVACGLGQVLRKLAVEEVDPTKLYGTDLLPTYIDLGFELFRDRDRFQGNFIAADLFQSDTALSVLEEKITIVHASNFFHLCNWEQQIQIASNIIRLFRPGVEGAMIFGRQIGRIHAGESRSWREGSTRYLHDLDSLQKLWDEIGKKTGTKWRVDAEWLGRIPFQIPGHPEDTMYLKFAVYQL